LSLTAGRVKLIFDFGPKIFSGLYEMCAKANDLVKNELLREEYVSRINRVMVFVMNGTIMIAGNTRKKRALWTSVFR